VTSTYTSARGDLAAAIATELGTDWGVLDHPGESLSDRSVAINMGPAQIRGPGRFVRELVIGVFVVRSSIEEGFDELDAAIPAIVRLDLDGLSIVEVTEPREVELGGVAYIAAFIPASMEVSNN